METENKPFKKMSDPNQEKEVREILNKVIKEKMLPKDAMGMDDMMMEGIYGQAYVLYNSGRYKEASQMFRLLITLNPTSVKYTMGLAASQHLMKDYQNAVVSYQICSMMETANPLPLYHASDCYLKMNDKEAAIGALTVAIDLAGNAPEYRAVIDRCKMTLQSLKE